MFSTIRKHPLVARLKHYWLRHWQSRQWLLDCEHITVSQCQGMQPRVLLSRSMYLYYCLDLSSVPSAKRRSALESQIKLKSPFNDSAHYVLWHQAVAQVWVWDASALVARLPEAEHHLIVPESALAPPLASGERWLAGINGYEWQQWQAHCLVDSRWYAYTKQLAEPIPFHRALLRPQARQQQYARWASALLGGVLIAGVLFQGASTLSLWRYHHQQQQGVSHLHEKSRESIQQRDQANDAQQLWLNRHDLFTMSQLNLVQQVAAALPSHSEFMQRYHATSTQLQLQLTDHQLDPREYVNVLSQINGLSSVSVRSEAQPGLVTVQANLSLLPREAP